MLIYNPRHPLVVLGEFVAHYTSTGHSTAAINAHPVPRAPRQPQSSTSTLRGSAERRSSTADQ
jgi:hypothetical protein